MTTRAATKTAVSPPPAAVAQDAHWAATRERLQARNRPVSVLTICDDDTVKRRLAQARYSLEAVKLQATTDDTSATESAAVTAAEAELAAAQEAFDAVAIVLRFMALPRPDFEELKRSHPATEEQAEEGMSFNPEALGPDLISAASMDGMTPEDAADYLTNWADGEANQLFSAAWDVQSHTRLDLGKG
ncbi:hypothetical protein ACIPW9_36105 [Streptomyces sp. NPDC090052]|uniref:hypothetical protein n=1 Tax=Streptomyces sp. NPDC090052 TaxID=3365931 RepID=UPI003809C376